MFVICKVRHWKKPKQLPNMFDKRNLFHFSVHFESEVQMSEGTGNFCSKSELIWLERLFSSPSYKMNAYNRVLSILSELNFGANCADNHSYCAQFFFEWKRLTFLWCHVECTYFYDNHLKSPLWLNIWALSIVQSLQTSWANYFIIDRFCSAPPMLFIDCLLDIKMLFIHFHAARFKWS